LGLAIVVIAVLLWPVSHVADRESGTLLLFAGGVTVAAGLWGRWRADVVMTRLTRAGTLSRTSSNNPAVLAIDAWFAERGFAIVLTKEGAEYWAHLVSASSREIAGPRYGRGATPEEAAESARHRYETEEGR
jgi:hypothetical protein